MPDPFIFPSPFLMTDLPTDVTLNPSIQSSQRGNKPHTPDISVTFTKAAFPRVVTPYSKLVANLDKHIVELIEAKPDDYLAVVPYSAGNSYYNEHPRANSEILAFIKSLCIGEATPNLSIAKASPRNKVNTKRDFEKPWSMILSGASTELRTYLIWQQTFASHPDITFSILPFDKSLQSWVIMNISGDAVANTPEAKALALGAIKHKLWHDSAFRSLTDRCLSIQKIVGSTSFKAHHATTSFDLTFIESHDTHGNEAPIWQLTGKPISEDPVAQECFFKIIRQHKYYVGMHALQIDKRIVECVWCKSNTHPGHACPFPKVEDWLGPKPDTVTRFQERFSSPGGRGGARRGRGGSSPGNGRRGSPHGGSRGGSSRGGGNSQGWNYVLHKK